MLPTTLKLKQRLAALSLTQSPPNAHELPADTWSPTTTKRKFFNNPPWVKSPTSPIANHAPGFTDSEGVQEVLSRMIFQAGVDFE